MNLSGTQVFQRSKQPRNERKKISQPVRLGPENDQSEGAR
jgi:hypothetical protein